MASDYTSTREGVVRILDCNPTYAGSRAHAPNEHIRLEDIEPALRFTYELLRHLGSSK